MRKTTLDKRVLHSLRQQGLTQSQGQMKEHQKCSQKHSSQQQTYELWALGGQGGLGRQGGGMQRGLCILQVGESLVRSDFHHCMQQRWCSGHAEQQRQNEEERAPAK